MIIKQLKLSSGTFRIPRPKIVRSQEGYEPKRDKSEPKIGPLIRFSNETSLEAFAHCIGAKSFADRIIWGIILIAACGALGFYLFKTFTNYQDRPKVVSINILHPGELFLPNFTICVPDRMSKKRFLELFPSANFSNWNDTLFANYLNSAFRLGEFPLQLPYLFLMSGFGPQPSSSAIFN